MPSTIASAHCCRAPPFCLEAAAAHEMCACGEQLRQEGSSRTPVWSVGPPPRARRSLRRPQWPLPPRREPGIYLWRRSHHRRDLLNLLSSDANRYRSESTFSNHRPRKLTWTAVPLRNHTKIITPFRRESCSISNRQLPLYHQLKPDDPQRTAVHAGARFFTPKVSLG
jgi:hypothetical protein